MSKESSKRRKITFESREDQVKLLEKLREYQGDGEELLDNLLSSSFYLSKSNQLKQNMSNLTSNVRMLIIDFISVKATRFFFDQSRYNRSKKRVAKGESKILYLYSYQTKTFITLEKYMRLLFGYFVQDYSRKVFLIFGYLVFRSNRSFMYLPRKGMRQLYVLNGEAPGSYMLSNISNYCKSLCFSDLQIVGKDLLEQLKKMKNLKKFAIQRIFNVCTPDMMRALYTCKIVRIMDCGMDDVCGKVLLSSPTLTNINLNNNHLITHATVAAMNKHNKLVHLRVNCTGIDDSIGKYIVKNDSIREIQVSSTSISPKFFWEVLTKHKHIHTIEAMDIDCVTLEFSKVQKTRNILAKRKNVERIYLDCTRLDMNTLVALSSLPTLKHISLFNTGCSNMVVKFILREFIHLERLNLGFNTQITQDALKAICETKHIKHLEYCQNDLTDEDLKIIFQNENFDRLSIQGNKITDQGFIPLKDNKTLTTLKLGGTNEKITEVGREYIKNCTQVLELIEGTEERPIIWSRLDPREEVFEKLELFQEINGENNFHYL